MATAYEHICPNCFDVTYHGGQCSKCGYTALDMQSSAIILPPGTVLHNRYLIGRVLGVGGFGITYLAMDLETNSRCAVKEYFPSSLASRETSLAVSANGRSGAEAFRHGRKVFLDEASILSQFAGEPLIVQVYQPFQANDTAYFAMEYLDGENAKTLTRSMGGKLPLENSLDILLAVAQALQKVHQKGLLHRDVSPENIFITKAGQVKLIDFGATRYFVGEASKSLSVILKPGFAPPEQYSSKSNQGPWTDVYALAASFYFMVSGQRIPEAPDRLAGKDVIPLRDLELVSKTTSSAIDKALKLDYRERLQNVDQFLQLLHLEEKIIREQRLPDITSTTGGNPYISIFSGRFKGNKWSIPKNMEIMIGRSTTESNVVIEDPNISRKHCLLYFDETQRTFYVKDISTNGTFNLKGDRFTKDVYTAIGADSGFYLSAKDLLIKVGLE